MTVEVDLNGAWVGSLEGYPVMIQTSGTGFRVIPCFDTEEKCRQTLYQCGAPMDEITLIQIESEDAFIQMVKDRMPGVRILYNLETFQGGSRGVLLNPDPESLH